MTKSYKAHVWAICDQSDDEKDKKDELTYVIKADQINTNLGYDTFINQGQEKGIGGYEFDKYLSIAILERDPPPKLLSALLKSITSSIDFFHKFAATALVGVPDYLKPSPSFLFNYPAKELSKRNMKPLGVVFIQASDAIPASKNYQYRSVKTADTRARYRIKYRIDILKPTSSGVSKPASSSSKVYKGAYTGVSVQSPQVAVLKRNGSSQPFNQAKYTASLTRAGATPAQANLVSNRVISRVGNQQSITSKQLSTMTARSLSRVNTTASRNYAMFRNQKSGR